LTVNAGRIRFNSNDRLGAGLVTLNGGTVSTSANSALSASNSILVGGNFGIGNATNVGAVTLSGSMDLGGATRTTTIAGNGATFSGVISNGGLTKSGTSNLTLSGTNTYSGDTLVQSGTLIVGSDLALQNSGFDTSGAGRLSLAGRTAATFGGLIGSTNLATSATYAGVSALTLNPQSGKSYDYGGIIANGTSTGMSLTKTGPGSQRLTGVSTYTGTTFVNAGRLEIAGSGNLANTAGVVINGSGAELKWNSSTALSRPITFTQGTISGTGEIGVAVTVATNDILSPGNSPGSQAYTAGLTWSPGGTYQWEINDATGAASTNWDILNVSGGALDLTGLSSGNRFALDLTTLTGTVPGPMVNYVDGQSYTFSLASYASLALPGGFSGNDLTSLFTLSFVNWDNPVPSLANVSVVRNTGADTIDLVIVPEPTGLAVAGIAFAAAGWLLRRRRTAA
jgi:autotransporter-associated beta strand protein